jgi:hypothetical protein
MNMQAQGAANALLGTTNHDATRIRYYNHNGAWRITHNELTGESITNQQRKIQYDHQ